MRLSTLTLATLTGITASALLAFGAGDQELYRSTDLRIYRGTGRDGVATIVLTNLDEEGHRLAGEITEEFCVSPPPAPAPSAAKPSAPDEAREASRGTEERGEEPSAGTTIVININTPPPAPVETSGYAPVVYQVIGTGAITGPAQISYPVDHRFLGYGLSVTRPGFFGGLGLNAGNRFGLKTGSSCGQGYDCLFGP